MGVHAWERLPAAIGSKSSRLEAAPTNSPPSFRVGGHRWPEKALHDAASGQKIGSATISTISTIMVSGSPTLT
jgi:hypothetical protein